MIAANRALTNSGRHPLPAAPSTWVQTASGKAMSLMVPAQSSVDFVQDIAPQLAKLARFNGATDGAFYSVAQHCVMGADALMVETRRVELAAYFLLHDAHEAYIGDTPTPVVAALAEIGRIAGIGSEGDDISHIFAELKSRLDSAIHAAAGLSAPDANIRAHIREMDLRMLATERRDLLRPVAGTTFEPASPIRGGRIRPWPWPKAADLWLARLKQYCPTALLRAA